jgi:hypothetical protein
MFYLTRYIIFPFSAADSFTILYNALFLSKYEYTSVALNFITFSDSIKLGGIEENLNLYVIADSLLAHDDMLSLTKYSNTPAEVAISWCFISQQCL